MSCGNVIVQLQATLAAADTEDALDIKLSASGFKEADQDAFDAYMKPQQIQCTSTPSASTSASNISDSIDGDEDTSIPAGHVGSREACDTVSDAAVISAVIAGPAAWTYCGGTTLKQTSMEGNEMCEDRLTSSRGSRSHIAQCL